MKGWRSWKAKKETKTNIMKNEELQGLVKREHTV